MFKKTLNWTKRKRSWEFHCCSASFTYIPNHPTPIHIVLYYCNENKIKRRKIRRAIRRGGERERKKTAISFICFWKNYKCFVVISYHHHNSSHTAWNSRSDFISFGLLLWLVEVMIIMDINFHIANALAWISFVLFFCYFETTTQNK